MLTGRREQFKTLRQFGGLSATFVAMRASMMCLVQAMLAHLSLLHLASLPHVICKAKLQVVAIIGDGALTGGMALEAIITLVA